MCHLHDNKNFSNILTQYMEIHPRVYNRTKKLKEKKNILLYFNLNIKTQFCLKKVYIYIYIYKNTLTTSVESCLTNACTDNLLGFKATYQITFFMINYRRGLSFGSILAITILPGS